MIPENVNVLDTFVVSDDKTLEHIRRHTAHFVGRGAYRHIEVATPVEHRERFEYRINAHYQACGCVESGISVLLTIAVLVTWRIAWPEHPVYAWRDATLDIGIVFVAALLGKLVGIVRSHLALQGTLQELARILGANNK